MSSGTSAATRAANLEQRLEDLVAILKAQATPTPPHASSQPDASQPHQQGKAGQEVRIEPEFTAPSATDWRSDNVSTRIVSGGPTVVTPAATSCATCSTANSTPSPLPAPAHDVLMSAPEAEETLALFRRHHLVFFPFVYLPPDMTYVSLILRLLPVYLALPATPKILLGVSATWLMLLFSAAQLQRDRPYLWLNICAICSKSPIKQAALARQSREEIAHRLLIACERNIDMLLGTLCFLGWYVWSAST